MAFGEYFLLGVIRGLALWVYQAHSIQLLTDDFECTLEWIGLFKAWEIGKVHSCTEPTFLEKGILAIHVSVDSKRYTLYNGKFGNALFDIVQARCRRNRTGLET